MGDTLTFPSHRVAFGDGSYRTFELVAYNQAEAASWRSNFAWDCWCSLGYLITPFTGCVGKVRMCRRMPIVAGVSRDKRSVSTSMSRICIVCKEASDDDSMV